MSRRLELRGVVVRRGTLAVGPIDLAVAAGQVLAVIGPSGSGKTSLLDAIAGFEAPAAGRIHVDGALASGGGRSVPPHLRGAGYLLQELGLFEHLSARENVEVVRRARKTRRPADVFLRMAGFERDSRTRVTELSGGERQRVALARVLATEAPLLLLDEPAAWLDRPLARDVALRVCEEVLARRAALVVTGQDRAAVRPFAPDAVLRLGEGGRALDIEAPGEEDPDPVVLTGDTAC